jgi:acetylornithine deacetylase/succinyl-diaminopimelate desuccinylase-like protein
MTTTGVSRLALALFLVAATVSLQCRRAAGESRDPVEHEAENALIGYLRIDTTNPPGNETAGALYLQKFLQKEQIASSLIGPDPRRQSLYARLSSGSTAPALVLLHHIDVVPADAAEWTHPPFSGARSGGYIWGRGALDTKGLGIAELMALVDLTRHHSRLRRDIIYLAVADEESGGLHGCGELLDRYPELFRNVGFVLNEGGYNETIVDKVAFWGIEVVQKVPLWIRLRTKGTEEHSASPPDDGGTIARLLDAIAAVRQIPRPYRLIPAAVRYFHVLGPTKRDERGKVMLDIEHSIGTPRLNALSAGYRSVLHDTMAITRIGGGSSTNAIPSTATADIDMRLLPDESPDGVLRQIRTAVGEKASVEVLLKAQATSESDPTSDLFRSVSAAMRRSDPGSVVGPSVGAGTSDSRFFRQRGIAAYGIAPFKVNYYDASTVHGIDERIRARFFSEGVRLMREIVSRFCAEPAR